MREGYVPDEETKQRIKNLATLLSLDESTLLDLASHEWTIEEIHSLEYNSVRVIIEHRFDRTELLNAQKR